MNQLSLKKRFKNFLKKYQILIWFFLLALAFLLQFGNSLLKGWIDTVKMEDYLKKLITDCSSFIANVLSVSFVLAQLLVIFKSLWKKYQDSVYEEERKTESNHHKIIRMFTKLNEGKTDIDCSGKKSHPILNIENNNNYFSKSDGDLMQIHKTVTKGGKRIKFESKAAYSEDAQKERFAIMNFLKGQENHGFLNIANLNLYTNLEENTILEVKDSNETHQLTPFIENNRLTLLGAHSAGKNNITIRLKDVSFDGKKTLSIKTERTKYLDMLISNRAMDYDLGGTTLRKTYEYKSKITPLPDSVFANHIGVTGVLISKDNYVLIEKRDRNKSTWRDKFGPTISLAIKEEDVVSQGELLNGNKFSDAIVKRIKKSLKENYNFLEGIDYDLFTFSSSFLGLARDLLEGGKPNMYFCIRLKKNAKELALDMQKSASLGEVVGESKRPYDFKKDSKKKHQLSFNKRYVTTKEDIANKEPLKKDKLTGDYYLVPYEQIRLDYYYQLSLPKGTINVKRIFTPRFKRGRNPTKLYLTKKEVVKECGEGLLATFSYLELFHAKKKRMESKDE